MSSNSVTKADLISWVEQALENENLSSYKISLAGKSEKGEGHLSEITFVTVNGTSKDNGKKEMNLVVKHGKSNDYLRKVSPIKDYFVMEIYFYEKILPTFKNFQLERNVQDVFDSVPKCYKTFIFGNMEVIIMDNLKKHGYELWDKLKPLNPHHLKAVLKEYGKFHALSFALRDQKKEAFNSLNNFHTDNLKQFLCNTGFGQVLQSSIDLALSQLQKRNDLHLLRKFKNLLVKDTVDMIIDLLEEEEPQSVIIHGDSWINNFMFKYEDADRTSPSKVAMLDWQICSLRSPAMDLSYFLYVTSSKEGLDKFGELMETYYASFSHFLKELGSNPEELFPYSDLLRHWRKYSLFGLIWMPMVFRGMLTNKEEIPEIGDLQEGEDMGSRFLVNVADEDLFYGRVKTIVNHHFEYAF